mmetsp:Transcript_67513/g.162034  ORF Transcript_67513/g.162034 Transcript_67513/m.162034 type:complete len:155 (+) Transcript_67513:97-561(+)|eukprot:CAMPEP_0178431844 /NCGR_PEP_ID=MMETSP0689_2-20121128/32072_1 /TAXON_ID=160604 /ORGANISM="Amphidinium massartii, Strain CS-259" /LENGTH=154 /DNA_ID=CAMNT_0020053799 /DNA_START=77 /DNA_END=541 /DNA_ORIENTATION=+
MSSAGATGRDGDPKMRSKGVLPAVIVGGTVYMITGFASFGTLALVGIGAGVGYGVGSWIADQYQSKNDGAMRGVTGQAYGTRMDQAPQPVQEAMAAWQDFLSTKAAGGQLTQENVDQAWIQFEQVYPHYAVQVRGMVWGSAGGPSSQVAQAAEV